MTYTGFTLPEQRDGAKPPQWLRVGVPLTLLLDLACLPEPGYPAILGEALAREGAAADPVLTA